MISAPTEGGGRSPRIPGDGKSEADPGAYVQKNKKDSEGEAAPGSLGRLGLEEPGPGRPQGPDQGDTNGQNVGGLPAQKGGEAVKDDGALQGGEEGQAFRHFRQPGVGKGQGQQGKEGGEKMEDGQEQAEAPGRSTAPPEGQEKGEKRI